MKNIKAFIVLMIMIFVLVSPAHALFDNNEVSPSVESYNYNNILFSNPGDSTVKANTQMQPLLTPMVVTPAYHGPVFKDHKIQAEILQFLLKEKGGEPFVISKRGLFTRKSAHSDSEATSRVEYAEKKRVYAFTGEDDLLKNVSNYSVVGYTDTYSKGKYTLMDCFNQAIIDAGDMGGNGVILLKIDFMAGLSSRTIGLGTSGAAGIMKGANQSSVSGAALGYASSKATPETNPYIYAIVIYSEDLPQELPLSVK